MELLVDGWAIEHMAYADRSGTGSGGPAAAMVELRRGREHVAVYVPDDERSCSHRAMVALLRERPHIWKHRSAQAAATAGPPPEDLVAPEPDEVPEPFPAALVMGPKTLRAVVPVNQSQAIGDVIIAVTSLELHDGGVRARYMALDEGPAGRRDMCLLDVLVVDDAGRIYRVAASGDTFSPGAMEGVLLIAPALPRHAGQLTIAVGGVGDDASGVPAARGPWVFPITLGVP